MTDALDRLKTLLETERQALKDGDLAKLVSLTDEKQDLTDALESERPPATALQEINAVLQGHAALLNAAREGVADVLARRREQLAAQEGLQTYDAHGQGSRIGPAPKATERRY